MFLLIKISKRKKIAIPRFNLSDRRIRVHISSKGIQKSNFIFIYEILMLVLEHVSPFVVRIRPLTTNDFSAISLPTTEVTNSEIIWLNA